MKKIGSWCGRCRRSLKGLARVLTDVLTVLRVATRILKTATVAIGLASAIWLWLGGSPLPFTERGPVVQYATAKPLL